MAQRVIIVAVQAFLAVLLASAVRAADGSCGASRPLVVGIAERCDPACGANVWRNCPDSIYRAGGVPVILRATSNRVEIARVLDRVDILFLCGGEDVDPARYRAQPSPKLGGTNAERDACEWALLDEAVKRRLPVFGICRGCQVINAYFGGTLWQDLPTEFPGGPNHVEVEHDIALERGSRLAAVLGCETLRVNSSHHQAVRDLAPGFRVAARAPDGVIEAIESDRYPAAGVQFHPEILYADEGREAFAPLFARLLKWTGAP